MRRTLITCVFACLGAMPLAAHEAKKSEPPRWDARGVGPLPRMGITSLDVSDDGHEVVVGTIAPFGDPNVIVLDSSGKVVRHYGVGQQWIDNVAYHLALIDLQPSRANHRVQLNRHSASCRGRGSW